MKFEQELEKSGKTQRATLLNQSNHQNTLNINQNQPLQCKQGCSLC